MRRRQRLSEIRTRLLQRTETGLQGGVCKEEKGGKNKMVGGQRACAFAASSKRGRYQLSPSGTNSEEKKIGCSHVR